jgi:DNA-binding NtrC family response regulator
MIHDSLRPGAQLPVRLLIAIPDNDQYQSFRNAIGDADWRVFRADTIADALSTIINHKVNTIVMSSDLEDGSWLEMIHALQPCRNAPRVLVASPQADDRLWLDVLEHGGYDLLAMPFDRSEILRVVPMAFLSWERNVRGLGSAWFPTHSGSTEAGYEQRSRLHAKGAGQR